MKENRRIIGFIHLSLSVSPLPPFLVCPNPPPTTCFNFPSVSKYPLNSYTVSVSPATSLSRTRFLPVILFQSLPPVLHSRDLEVSEERVCAHVVRVCLNKLLRNQP